jgi:hypothetical protein
MPHNPKIARTAAKTRTATKRRRNATAKRRTSASKRSEPSLMERSIAELRATVEAFGHALESYMPGMGTTAKSTKSTKSTARRRTTKSNRTAKGKAKATGTRKPVSVRTSAKRTPRRSRRAA